MFLHDLGRMTDRQVQKRLAGLKCRSHKRKSFAFKQLPGAHAREGGRAGQVLKTHTKKRLELSVGCDVSFVLCVFL